jgi:mannose-6-phosphate isomerase-like protein (cupin superfamily)
MGYKAATLDELGSGHGFRKVRKALDVEAFGVNGIVTPPGFEAFLHYHETQDELYFVHAGTATFDVDGDEVELGPGGLIHVDAATPRRFRNTGDEDLVLLVIGGKGGYVERDGVLVDLQDLARRQSFGEAGS